jgi:hypothetical protein
VKAKQSFETLVKSLGVKIQHYHADNGRFADKAFLKDFEDKGQTVSFCGVRAHFQNGIAERRISGFARESTHNVNPRSKQMASNK